MAPTDDSIPGDGEPAVQLKLRLAGEISVAAERITHLAALVEQTGLSAADVGKLFQKQFQQSQVEQSYDIRKGVADMARSGADSPTFAAGLRDQARKLRSQADLLAASANGEAPPDSLNNDDGEADAGQWPRPHKPR